MKPRTGRTVASTFTVLALIMVAAAGAAEGGLSAADRSDIARIEAYLKSVDSMKARFLQTSTDGRIAEGMVYMDRPGRMRMTYAPPLALEVIATGTLLVYHDKAMRQVSQVPLAATPAAVLLAEIPKLSGEVTVTEVERVGTSIKVTLVQTGREDAGSLMLGFSDRPLLLRRVVLRDAEGSELRVGLVEHEVGLPLDPGLFEFTDPYAGSGRD